MNRSTDTNYKLDIIRKDKYLKSICGMIRIMSGRTDMIYKFDIIKRIDINVVK